MSVAPTPDRDSAPWWRALADHRLTLQRCDTCGLRRWAPRAMCSGCGGFTWSWETAGGRGTVASWTVSHRAFLPGRPTPYVVLLVRLEEGEDLILPGGWDGPADGTGLRVGLPVVAGYHDLETAAGAEEADDAERASLLVWHAAD
ncbi:Zn-ribbon domain-containing OB-fold protein [Streptomyces spiralis]|uniref:Zn-ribbon domain-containing OB-fold protein n=1 Tax=Streptomyces spiralis TaxID=66376 RepID=UPI0033EA9F58